MKISNFQLPISKQCSNSKFQTLKKIIPAVKKNVSLKEYTTFRIDGKAKYFYLAKNKNELIKAILAARKLKLPFFVLAGGSNLLVNDRGYGGLVIKLQITNYKLQTNSKKQIKNICVETGVSLGELVNFAFKKNLSGLEWASGIPGMVGGAIYGNAGAFGKSMRDVVKSVEVFDLKTEKTKFLKNKNCQFGYRDSIFKKKKNLIILSAEIKLRKGKKKEIEKKIKEYLVCKKETQPLNFPSAGSVFKNSTVAHKNLCVWPKELKKFKKNRIIPASWLIEKCGLKGKKIGNAQISEKHANFIINLGEAKAKDVISLINLAKKEVKKKFGVKLEEEIELL